MEKTKHTPGPWAYRPTASLGPQYKVHPEADGPDIAIVYDHGGTEANAALIAAAPDLMEAAVDMVGWWEAWAHIAEVLIGSPLRRSIEMRIEEFRMAIAKAKGD